MSASIAMAQQENTNYVKTKVFLDADQSQALTSIQYYDGLGRPFVSSMDGFGTTGKATVHTFKEYDRFGREARTYMPVPGTSLECPNPDEIAQASGSFYNDSKAYTEKSYDALNRPTSLFPGGEEWYGKDKKSIIGYNCNTANEVKLYKLENDKLKESGYWPNASLTKENAVDEDGNTVETYKNLFGEIILQRIAGYLDIYYVYDDLGHLRFVLTPSYQKNTSDRAINTYEYRYDNRGRIVKKFIPGAEYIQYWYDNADRIVCMQDGEMRNNGKYRFFLYDAFGRQVIRGISTNCSADSTVYTATFDASSAGFLETNYTVSAQCSRNIENPVIETIDYYDGLEFMTNKYFSDMSLSADYRQMGQLTGTVASIGNGEYTSRAMAYDLKGNLIKSVSRKIGGSIVILDNEYTFTNNVESSVYDIDVKYGEHLSLQQQTTYNQYNDKKESSVITISHGDSKATSTMSYTYDDLGRLSKISRPSSDVLYSYDLHGWLKNTTAGSFNEELFYADCPDKTYNRYNGNIGITRWTDSSQTSKRGYKLEYDGANRMTNATYGEGDDLNSNIDMYNESVEYDDNGNITSIARNGKMQNETYGKIDDLTISFKGNQQNDVKENATELLYDGSFDYKGTNGSGYSYNANGSLVADKSRGIAWISYDYNNNPTMIYFTNGNITEYIYSATGQKLRVVHRTAKSNVITREVGVKVTTGLTAAQTLYADSTDYIMDGTLTMKNGRIDKYLFDGGYCQAQAVKNCPTTPPPPITIPRPRQQDEEESDMAESGEESTEAESQCEEDVCYADLAEYMDTDIEDEEEVLDDTLLASGVSTSSTTSATTSARTLPYTITNKDTFAFYFYNKDHLGNIREVVDENGSACQVTNYYPFGTPYCDEASITNADLQPYKYNSKELDRMHGLDTYDYGARQYDPLLCRWTSVDPLCEKYYGVSPYVYCANNPVMLVDPDGRKVVADSISQENITYTLNSQERDYIQFVDGILNYELLNTCNSNSANISALKALAKSDITYTFKVSNEHFGKKFFDKGEDKANPSNFSYGITCIPMAENDPSPDSNVYIFTASFLNKGKQVMNTAHEGYGHAYFYELSKKDSSINPFHTKGVVGYFEEEINGSVCQWPIFGPSNQALEEQIKKVENEALNNYNNF